MEKIGSNSSYFWPSMALVAIALLSLFVLAGKTDTPSSANWIPQWKIAAPFSTPRRALSAVASTTHLYAVGGIDDRGHYVREIEFAPIKKDGAPENWQKTAALIEGRFYLASVIVGQYLFVLGGGIGAVGDDNLPTASVERARIRNDGSLGPFETVASMQLPRRGLKAVAVGNRIYAIGGYSGVFLKSTEYTTVKADGTLSPWVLEPQQSHLDRYIHSASYLNGRIYLLGGHVQNSSQISYGDVESAQVSPLGPLSPWEIEPSKLLTPRFIAASFALDDKLYMLGGHNGGARLNSVEFARVFRNGRVGNWSLTSPLNTPRSAAATAVSGQTVYVLGGMGNSNALNSVEFATTSKSGQLGHFVKK